MRKIVIFIPKAGYGASYQSEFVESYISAKNYLFSKIQDIPFEFTISEYFAHTFPIDANRNECVSMALNNDIDLSIFFDTDHIISHDAIYKMIKHDLPIVAGIYYAKSEPFQPIVFLEDKEKSKDFDVFSPIYFYPDKELFEADMTGMGCVAIKKEVLKTLAKPYFKYRPVPEILALDKNGQWDDQRQYDDELKKLYDKWVPTAKFKVENDVFDCSEDVWFWRNIRYNTEYKLIIDPTIQLPHGPHRLWIDKHYAKAYMEMRKAEHIKKFGQESFDKDFAKLCRVEAIKSVK